MDRIETKSLLIKLVEDGAIYQVWTAFHPEIGIPSYAIYNKVNDIVEHYQPNIVNALNIRDEFVQWWDAKVKGDNTQAVIHEFGNIDGQSH